MIKIGSKHQVTIPKEIVDQLGMQSGDYLEVVTQEGKIIMIPKQLADRVPAPHLTPGEQKALLGVIEKVSKVRLGLANSQGLTDREVRLATKVGLINPDQAWWWKEEWKKGGKASEKRNSAK